MRSRSNTRSSVQSDTAGPTTCPWDELGPDGAGLDVHDFITTQFSYTSNSLRRAITLPYAERYALTVSEWRMLSVLAGNNNRLAYPDLVQESSADKAQVSRALRLMSERGLVDVQTPPSGRKGMVVVLTAEGRALYERIMPHAQRSQAEMILSLTQQERRILYDVLHRLRARCDATDSPPGMD